MLTYYILQYEGLWRDWEDMGLLNSTVLVDEKYCRQLVQELPVNLMKELPNIPQKDKDKFCVAVNACSSDTIMKFKAVYGSL